jgi:crossover junction endodeoxyribonuclease RusA
VLTLILPWPPRDLSPNSRVHWARLARAKRSYREVCAWQALEQGARRLDAARLDVSLVFVPPSRRPIDLDNCLAMMKAGLDGLADVLGVDDSRWRITIEREDSVGGFVRVTVRVCP